jgi:hypothetical protein
MNSLFENIAVNHVEYQYWLNLSDSDKLVYLFQLYSIETNKNNQSITAVDLTNFFKTVYNELDSADNHEEITNIDNFDDDQDRVDVMIDENNIMIESNSLRAVRYVIFKFVESGYIIRRDIAVEKMFRKDKVTKYLRIFKIINQAPDICSN